MRKLPFLLFSVALLAFAPACPDSEPPPTGDGDGDAGDGDGDGDPGDGDGDGDAEPTDGGPAADGGSASDGGAIAGDGDGDGDGDAEPTDGGPAADGGSASDGGAIAGDGDGDGDAGTPDVPPGSQPGSLDVAWIHGSQNCNTNNDPPLQVHAYNADTYILRMNMCLNFEGPFIYLLFGEDKVLMQDTGANAGGGFPMRDTVEGIIEDWLAARGRDRSSLELLVTHTHSHGDHVANDGQFQGQPYTTLVGTSTAAVTQFFGFTDWPYEVVTVDLGNRVLEVTGVPGHQNQSVAVYDQNSGLLLTGDTFYSGFLFIQNYQTYRTSIGWLTDFALARDITWILGTHVEMTSTPGQVYPYGSTWQPSEHVLQLTLDNLVELDAALTPTSPGTDVHDDFIIDAP